MITTAAFEEQNHCRYYNSGLPCGPKCKFIHSEDKRKQFQVLLELKVYYRETPGKGFICPNSQEATSFFNELKAKQICYDFYLL